MSLSSTVLVQILNRKLLPLTKKEIPVVYDLIFVFNSQLAITCK